MDKLCVNSGGPDQTPRSAASDLGLHCLPITLLGVSSLQPTLLHIFIVYSSCWLVRLLQLIFDRSSVIYRFVISLLLTCPSSVRQFA